MVVSIWIISQMIEELAEKQKKNRLLNAVPEHLVTHVSSALDTD